MKNKLTRADAFIGISAETYDKLQELADQFMGKPAKIGDLLTFIADNAEVSRKFGIVTLTVDRFEQRSEK